MIMPKSGKKLMSDSNILLKIYTTSNSVSRKYIATNIKLCSLGLIYQKHFHFSRSFSQPNGWCSSVSISPLFGVQLIYICMWVMHKIRTSNLYPRPDAYLLSFFIKTLCWLHIATLCTLSPWYKDHYRAKNNKR